MRILMATTLAAASTLAGASFSTTASAQGGSYTASCRNVANLGNGAISAECADGSGRYRSTTIQANQCQGDIGNQNGMLACNGAVASGGQYIPDNSNSGRNRSSGGSSVGTALGAGALGALAGAFLNNRYNNSRLYQQGYNYPDYGQQGYGNPATDPRFAQGGWGYGSNGQWVSIESRADWLNGRIREGRQVGTISPSEARTFNTELNYLVRMERYDRQNGFSDYERTQLDKRFDRLAARISFEETVPHDHPGQGYNNRGYDNGGGYNRGAYGNGGYNNGGYNSGGYNSGGYNGGYRRGY